MVGSGTEMQPASRAALHIRAAYAVVFMVVLGVFRAADGQKPLF